MTIKPIVGINVVFGSGMRVLKSVLMDNVEWALFELRDRHLVHVV